MGEEKEKKPNAHILRFFSLQHFQQISIVVSATNVLSQPGISNRNRFVWAESRHVLNSTCENGDAI